MHRTDRVSGRLVAAAAALLVAALVDVAPAAANPLNPASPQARLQGELFWLTMGIATVVLVVVEVLILYAALRFRRPVEADPDAEPMQVHGNGRLELMWTILPGLILVFLFSVSVRSMAELTSIPPAAERIQVSAQQFLWEFSYPASGVKTSNDLRVPVGRPVVLEITSTDVIHSVWVPDLAGKVDANPGMTNRLSFVADRAGEYRGVCAELCGVGHGNMLFTVTAMEAPEFDAWLQAGGVGGAPVAAAAAAKPSAEVALGKKLMVEKGCAACHKIAGYPEMAGAIGPELSKVGGIGGSRKAGVSAEAYLKESIANPNAFVVQGYPAAMPALQLADDELNALVAYLLTLK